MYDSHRSAKDKRIFNRVYNLITLKLPWRTLQSSYQGQEIPICTVELNCILFRYILNVFKVLVQIFPKQLWQVSELYLNMSLAKKGGTMIQGKKRKKG